MDNRVKVHESTLEKRLLKILEVTQKVMRIWDQYPCVSFVTSDGQRKKHTFDFLAEFKDGRRVAYAVKPKGKVEKSGIQQDLECIREQCLANLADKAVLITEEQATEDRYFNAKVLLRARKMRSQHDVERVARIVEDIQGAVRLADLVNVTGMGARGRVALICLIDDGVLTLAGGQRIDALAKVRIRQSK